MDTERSTLAVIAVVCFLVGASGVVVAFDLAASVHVSGGVPLGAPDGMTVTLDGSTQANLEDISTLGGTVNVVTQDGNATFYSAGEANATVHASDIEGTWTNVSEIDADSNTIQINPDDKAQATVGKSINTVAWRSGIAEDDGTVDFAYDGGAGDSRVTVQGVSADTRLAAFDAASGEILDEATSGSGGSVTFDQLDSGNHEVLVQQFDPTAPSLSNPQPTGGTSQAPTEVSVDVEDADFGQGDSVTVTIDVDGSQVHQETITSAQTVTASVPSSGQTGGSHSWSVTAEDDYGESTSESYSYQVPTELSIHDEETGDLLDDQQVNLTVYTRDDTPEILTFNTSNGVVDLEAGFPASEPFVVVAESEGYLDRRIFVQNVYQTQDLYLLNESVQHTDVIFRIQDYTGRFPPDETVLEVQRGIGGNWTTVLGDYFGANDQFTAQIRYNTRHRLVLVNAESGERRVLGTYTPLAAGTETITVSPEGELDLPDEFPTVEFTPSAGTLPGENGVDVSSTITEGSEDLANWSVSMYHIDGATNTTLYSESSSNPTGGTREATLDLSDREGSIKVVTAYELESGLSGSRIAEYSIQDGAGRSMTILSAITGLVGLIPGQNQDTVKTLTAMILVVLGTGALGSIFRLSSEGMGLVVLALVSAFSILGWLPYSLLFTVLVLGASIALLRRRY